MYICEDKNDGWLINLRFAVEPIYVEQRDNFIMFICA